jgi:dipeptide/tripeptide permease
MVNRSGVAKSVFIVSFLGILLSGFYAFLLSAAMYAPPELMAQAAERKSQEFMRIVIAIVILVVVCIVSYLYGNKQVAPQSPKKEQ